MRRPATLGLLTSLYFAQGVPYGFFTQALPVLLRERGLSLAAIGATSLLFLPWALKFLWAPLVDHTGSRKHWILALQVATLAGALLLSTIDLEQSLLLVFAAMVVFSFLAATQDIATDGLAVRLLGPADRGLGNGIQVGAYRLGMIYGGGALLWIFAHSGWSTMFVGMAAALFVTCLPVLLVPAREAGRMVEPAVRPSAGVLVAGWMQRLRVPGFVPFIALICAYKFGDAMASALVGPFMHDAGLTKSEIALVKGTIGSTMGLAGAALGGFLAWRLGRRRALIACGVLQTSSLVLYVLCALDPADRNLIIAASTAEHLLGGMATVALFTLMMDASDPAHAGTDYTLLASAVVIVTGGAGILAGLIGDTFGYAVSWIIACVLSGAGCWWLVTRVDRGVGPRRLDDVWPPTSSGLQPL
ncbi:MAG TPA: MFS transporter [Nevskiaceae bacterium]|nr:MFS transporter [Nevskiaceae bacterium]